MKVAELIKALQHFNYDSEVFMSVSGVGDTAIEMVEGDNYGPIDGQEELEEIVVLYGPE